MVGVIFFCVKYVFRTLHMLTFALIFGNACYDFYFGRRFSKLQGSALALNIASSIILMASGLINMILLVVEKRYEKNSSYQLWKRLLIAKFFFSLMLTPLLEKSFRFLGLNEDLAVNVRLSTMVALFLMSPFLRFYREYYLVPTKVEVKTN